MFSRIEYISYYLPENNFSNQDASCLFNSFSPEKIFQKTGIKNRRISKENQYTSDLATKACEKLFSESSLNKNDVDYLIICTQSPDHLLPSTACIVHENLNLSKWIGAIDINQGCSGYVYSLGIAKSLIETQQAKNVLLVTADTYSKHLNPLDHATRTIFGDAAAATFINKNSNLNSFGQFVYGTDGSGAKNLISYKGGLKQDTTESKYLYMNGPEIFYFTLNAVPSMLEKLFQRNNTNIDEIDFFIFHQANKFMLDSLQKKLAIPKDKFLIFMSEHGNTVSSSIPITISENIKNGKIKKGHKLALVGFGVGYSYSSTIITV